MGSKRGGNRILDKRARQVSPLIKIETFFSESNPLKFLQHQNDLNYKKEVNPKGGQNSILCIISLRVEVWLAQSLKAETQLRPTNSYLRTKCGKTMFPHERIF
jgi:hypothetical protein